MNTGKCTDTGLTNFKAMLSNPSKTHFGDCKSSTYKWCLKKASEASDAEEKRNYEELADMWANK